MLVRREGSGSIPLLEPAERRVIGGVRIGGFVLGDEDEVGQRIAGMTVVEEQETQRVTRPNVLGRNRENALEKLLRLGRIAVALTVQCGDRKVDAKIQSIRSGGRRARECFGRPIEVELAHEPDAAVVQRDDLGGCDGGTTTVRTRASCRAHERNDNDGTGSERGDSPPATTTVHGYLRTSLVEPEAARMTPTPCSMAMRVPNGCDRRCSRSRMVRPISGDASRGTPRPAPRAV